MSRKPNKFFLLHSLSYARAFLFFMSKQWEIDLKYRGEKISPVLGFLFSNVIHVK